MRRVGLLGAAVLLAVPGTAHAAPATATVSGILERTVADVFPGAAESTVVATAAGAVIAVPDGMAEGIRSGAKVTLTRDADGAATRVTGPISIAAAPSAAGTHHLTIVPLAWQAGATLPTTAQLTALAAKTDAYYDASTGGAVRFVLDRVTAPQQVAAPAGACDPDAIQSAARAVTGATVRDRFHHVVAYFPAQPACGWSGLGTLGPGRHGDGFVWINGTTNPLVLGHELGHNMGLRHANGFDCHAGDGRPVALSDHCEVAGYADRWDIMGNLATGHLSAAHLDDLGLLTGGTEQISGDRRVVLAPLSGGSGLRQVTYPAGSRTYLLEYRDGGGLDERLAVGTGLAVRLVDSTLGGGFDRDHHLISFHPAERIPVLRAGEGWSGPFSLRVGTPTAAGLPVTFGGVVDATPPSAFTLRSPARSTTTGVTVTWTPVTDDSGVATIAVLIDGRAVTTLPGTATQATVAVPDGTHRLQAVATDHYGNRTTTPATTITVDGTAPRGNPAPTARLRAGGTATATSLPVTVSWGLTDLSGVARQKLGATPLGPAVRQVDAAVKPGARTRWQLTATDGIGHTGAVTGPWTTGTVDSGRTTRTGAWRTVKGKALLGASEHATNARNATFSVTGTGRSFGWIGTRDRTGGDVDVYADGKRIGSVSQYSGRARNRTVMYVITWPAAGSHTVKLVNRGTGGRPRMSVDAFAVLS